MRRICEIRQIKTLPHSSKFKKSIRQISSQNIIVADNRTRFVVYNHISLLVQVSALVETAACCIRRARSPYFSSVVTALGGLVSLGPVVARECIVDATNTTKILNEGEHHSYLPALSRQSQTISRMKDDIMFLFSSIFVSINS